MGNYTENTKAAASWTNEFNWKGFFCVTCTAVLENRSIMCIIEGCFVADMSPAMLSVILDGNKEARGKTSYGWRSLWCLHRGPCFVILFIWSCPQREDPNVWENILIAVIWGSCSRCWTFLKSLKWPSEPCFIIVTVHSRLLLQWL